MAIRKLTIAALLAASMTTQAERLPPGPVAVSGTGAATCSEVMVIAENVPKMRFTIRQWVDGYINGLNRYYPGRNAHKGLKTEIIVAAALDFCPGYPDRRFFFAVDSVLGLEAE